MFSYAFNDLEIFGAWFPDPNVSRLWEWCRDAETQHPGSASGRSLMIFNGHIPFLGPKQFLTFSFVSLCQAAWVQKSGPREPGKRLQRCGVPESLHTFEGTVLTITTR